MTKTTTQFAALALSALMTFGVVAGMNGIATKEYVAADRLSLAQDGLAQVALQQVIVVGHRTAV
jgi:hypothetical protein